MANSVVFISSSGHDKETSCSGTFRQLFIVSPNEIAFRIFTSFVPPFNKKHQKVYVDLLGPLLAVIMIMGFVTYGNSLRQLKINFSPIEFIFLYSVIAPLLYYFMSRLGNSKITLYKIMSLVGYALYGHLVTLLVSFIFFQEESNFFFFICLVFFGGLSTLRLALVVLGTIQIPAARLMICTLISVLNLLCLIFLHFGFMHRTFVYKSTIKLNN